MSEEKPKQLSHEKSLKIKRFHNIFADKVDWKIHSGKWKRLQCRLAFANLPDLSPVTIQLYGNNEPSIIESLTFPVMSKLLHLNLKNNKIKNLNGISQLKTPNLMELIVSDNDLICIKPLIKLYAPRLEYLNANRIMNIESISKCHIPNIKVLILGLNCLTDFRTLNKCHWRHIQRISIQNNRKCGRDVLVAKWNSQVIYG